MRSQSRNVRVAALAGQQWGVVSRGQLLDCGLDSAAISRWTEQGRLHRIHPGAYAVGHREVEISGRLVAALFHAGPGAALSHQTGGWWWKLVEAVPRRIHVSTPRDIASRPDVRVHGRRRLDRIRHRGLPVTTPARTLLDLAFTLPVADLRRALAEADYRGLLDAAAIERLTGRGRPGATALREAISLHLPQLAVTRSALERRFLLLVERSGLRTPEVNAVVEGLMVDALWRDARLVVELDGHVAHARPAAAERDRERELALRATGFAVLRYTWRQVTAEPERVITDVRRALNARSPR